MMVHIFVSKTGRGCQLFGQVTVSQGLDVVMGDA